MSIIPLEKLIEYRGNRYELTKAMIELARNGEKLLDDETKERNGKYIQSVIKNILDGHIKYEYEEESPMSVDKYAPFKKEDSTPYDTSKYASHNPEDEAQVIESEIEIEVEYDDLDDDEESMDSEEE